MPVLVSVFATVAVTAGVVTVAGAATDFWAFAHRHEPSPRFDRHRVGDYRRLLVGLVGYGTTITFTSAWITFALIEGAVRGLSLAASLAMVVGVFGWALGERSLRVHAVEATVPVRRR